MTMPGHPLLAPKGPAGCFTCSTCGYYGPGDPTRPGCVVNCPHKNGADNGETTPPPSEPPNTSAAPRSNGATTMQQAEFMGIADGVLRYLTTQFTPGYPPGSPSCAPGAPYPCPPPVMHPSKPGVIFGAPFPEQGIKQCGCTTWQEAVRSLCYVGASLFVPDVPPGGVVVWTQSVKWWWQAQHVMNLGDQANPSFRLTRIKYGTGEYQLTFKTQSVTINGIDFPLNPGQNGIDIRRWNMTSFANKNYPFPASALDDEVELEFTQVAAGNATLQLDFGGPALLQS